MQRICTKRGVIYYELDQSDFTADVVIEPNGEKNVFIPRSIFYCSNEYIIKSIKSGSFNDKMSSISVNFAEDSELTTIHSKAFENLPIDILTFPSHLKELEEGWCYKVRSIECIIISPENPYFSIYEETFIIRKSDPESELFDTLVFVLLDKIEQKIPSFIKYIDSYAFSKCSRLKSLEFEENSELYKIGKYAFSYSSLCHILIPRDVREIEDYAFYGCRYLHEVEFEDNSELVSIGRKAFSQCNLINGIAIPPKVEILGENWCQSCQNLREIFISSENKNFSFYEDDKRIIGKILLAKSDLNNDYYDVMNFIIKNSIQNIVIASEITEIKPFIFAECDKLQSVSFVVFYFQILRK